MRLFIPKRLTYALVGIAIAVYAMVLTTGHLDWYYESVELIQADGAAKLIKDYGPLHKVYLIYILSYFAAMLAVVSLSLKRSKGASQKLAGLMLAVVIGNIGMWLVEKLVPLNFEFLSVSYVMSAFVMFFVYWLLQDYIHLSDVPKYTAMEQKRLGIDIATMPMEIKISKVLLHLKVGEHLAHREREILEMILDNKRRKDIAAELYLSENTVKTYTRTLYSKLGVTCR